MKTSTKISNKFDETKFAKSGGSCFECCNYEEMYGELKSLFYSQDKALEFRTKENEELTKRVLSAEGIKDLNLAIVALYKMIGYSNITQDTINYATHLMNNYEQHRISQYIRRLENNLTNLMEENRELSKQLDN